MSHPRPRSERQALMVLNALEGWGPISGRQILEWAGGDWERVFGAPLDTLQAVAGRRRAAALHAWPQSFDLEREEARLQARGDRFITFREADYPARLRSLPDAPLGLYWRGPATLPSRAIAIVGTRHATAYGRKVAAQLAGELSRGGFAIVSGLALGIDREAHGATLQAGGTTLAVLGHGLEIVYPPRNASLFSALAEEGALVSEFPLFRRPDRQSFPQRNRLVSGMTMATIVVETGERGGSLITAKFAMEQNRTVFAVPGRIDQPHSRGCLALIRDGATLLTSVDDVLEELQFMQLDLGLETAPADGPAKLREERLARLAEDERTLIEALGQGETLHLDQLCERTGLPPFRVHAALMMLELQRLVLRDGDGRYESGL